MVLLRLPEPSSSIPHLAPVGVVVLRHRWWLLVVAILCRGTPLSTGLQLLGLAGDQGLAGASCRGKAMGKAMCWPLGVCISGGGGGYATHRHR